MNAALADISPWMAQSLWHGFVVFIRIGAVVSLLPAFGEQSVPMRIRLIVVLAFSLIVAPAVEVPLHQEGTGFVATIIVTETLVGVVLGLGIRMFVLALQTAGSIAAQSTSLAQILGGAAVEPIPAMGYILIVAALALAVMMGLHVKAAEFLILSYDLFPIGEFVSGPLIGEWGTAQVARAFSLAFTLAAPFVILSVIYNLALGAINKAMPQLMVAFVGAPVITAGGLILLLLAAPMMLTVWLSSLDGFLFNPFGAIR